MTDKPRQLPPSPVTETRLAEIRSWRDEVEPWDVDKHSLVWAADDLLDLVDHLLDRAISLEAILADVAMDEGARMGRSDGVAAALALLAVSIEQLEFHRDAKPRGFGPVEMRDNTVRLDYAYWLRDLITVASTPAELPPHSQTIAAARRMRLALERILAVTDSNPGGLDQRTHVIRIAREALKGGDA